MNASGPQGAEVALEDHLSSFRRRRFIAMPIAGTIAWLGIALAGATLSPIQMVWAVYIGTGSIFYLGLGVARLTGEDLLNRSERNPFDRLFMATVFMSLLVFAIAIPFAAVDYTSLPLSVGILSGLMWAPISWLIGHWVGVFHATARTCLVCATWFAFPERRFVVIPLVIVAVYCVTIVALEIRWRRLPDLAS